MKRTAVIMAGGTGERFWPLSRKTTPKQLLPLVSSKTMLEDAVERVSGIIPPEDVFIVTSKLLQQPIRSVLKNVPPENVVAEPCKRNTAPCLALAAAFIKAKYGKNYIDRDISIAVLTADHSIQPKCGFEATIAAALDYVEENDAISIIGITPTRPDTGYGYIELGKVVSPENSLCTIHQAVSFKEKPDIDTACAYLESGTTFGTAVSFFGGSILSSSKCSKPCPKLAHVSMNYHLGSKIPSILRLKAHRLKSSHFSILFRIYRLITV